MTESNYLYPDTVSIRCRVRKSCRAKNPEYRNAQEMLCLLNCRALLFKPIHMTNVPRSKTSCRDRPISTSDAQLDRPQSVVSMSTPEEEIRTRAKSPTPTGLRSSYTQSRGRSRTPGATAYFAVQPSEVKNIEIKKDQSTPFHIPIADIIAVDVLPDPRTMIESDIIYITARNIGCCEIFFHDRDSQEILLSFLRAWVPKRRVKAHLTVNDQIVFSDSSSCVDMDRFEEKAVEKRFQNESAMQKINRRFLRFVTSLEEFVCICGHPKANITVTSSSSMDYPNVTAMELDENSLNETKFSEHKEDAFIDMISSETK